MCFSVVYNEKMYIFGGYNSVIEQHFNDMYEFNPESHVWKKLNCLGKNPCERRRQACVAVGDRIFIFGGTRFVENICLDFLLVVFSFFFWLFVNLN